MMMEAPHMGAWAVIVTTSLVVKTNSHGAFPFESQFIFLSGFYKAMHNFPNDYIWIFGQVSTLQCKWSVSATTFSAELLIGACFFDNQPVQIRIDLVPTFRLVCASLHQSIWWFHSQADWNHPLVLASYPGAQRVAGQRREKSAWYLLHTPPPVTFVYTRVALCRQAVSHSCPLVLELTQQF